MNIADIKIFPCFSDHSPNPEMMARKARYFEETGQLQSEIVLDSENYLIDGYTSYLLAKQHHIENVPIRYGKRQLVRAYHRQNNKLYAWELPPSLADQVSIGDLLLVHTQHGVRSVTVATVEEYHPQEHSTPLRTVIRRIDSK